MLKLEQLTTGERLFLERRRLGESQVEAAKRRKMSRYRYRQLEIGLSGPKAPLRVVRDYEGCAILRRRSGIPLHELAREVDVSRWWLCQMERGDAPADRLIEFWGAKNGNKKS